jgi:hypothetical protein
MERLSISARFSLAQVTQKKRGRLRLSIFDKPIFTKTQNFQHKLFESDKKNIRSSLVKHRPGETPSFSHTSKKE